MAEGDEFGNFEAFPEASAAITTDYPIIEIDDDGCELHDFANWNDLKENLSVVNAEIDASVDTDIDDFGDLPSFDEITGKGHPSDHVEAFPEATHGNSVNVATEIGQGVPEDGGGGGFDDFGDPNKDEGSPDDENAVVEAASTSQPPVASGDDDFGDFGDFGDFDMFEDAPMADSPECASDDRKASASLMTQNADIANSTDDGADFGEFIEFSALVAHKESAEDKPAVAVTTPVEVASLPNDDDCDEFGEFGDFDTFEKGSDAVPPEEDERGPRATPPVEVAPPNPASILLGEDVHLMFQDVFACEDQIDPAEERKGIRTELPFNIPMSKILVSIVRLHPRFGPPSSEAK